MTKMGSSLAPAHNPNRGTEVGGQMSDVTLSTSQHLNVSTAFVIS